MGHKSKDFGIYSTWQNYIMWARQSSSCGIAASSSSGVCSAVSCGQVMSKDVPSLWYLIQCICSGDSINRFSVTILYTCLCVIWEYIKLCTTEVITWELKQMNTLELDTTTYRFKNLTDMLLFHVWQFKIKELKMSNGSQWRFHFNVGNQFWIYSQRGIYSKEPPILYNGKS